MTDFACALNDYMDVGIYADWGLDWVAYAWGSGSHADLGHLASRLPYWGQSERLLTLGAENSRRCRRGLCFCGL